MLTLEQALQLHAAQPFSRTKPAAALIKRYFHLPKRVQRDKLARNLLDWLLVPFSLWPIDFIGAGATVLDALEAGKRPDPLIEGLFELLDDLPSKEECGAVASHEQDVAKGLYSAASKADFKFSERLSKVQIDPAFQSQWNWLKKHFPIAQYQVARPVLRRRMISERGFRPSDWDWGGTSVDELFQHAFDAFCHRWCLYGMEGDTPLLQKFSVSLTPHGTMVFIPRYWSFSPHHDVNWKGVTRLHRSRSVSRQGPKLSEGRTHRLRKAAEAKAAHAEARRKGLKGEEYREWMVAKLSLPASIDSRQLRRLVSGK